MARRPKSVADVEREIEALKQQRQSLLNARAEQIGKLAAKAELHTLDITDKELLKMFEDLVARFRAKAAPAGSASS